MHALIDLPSLALVLGGTLLATLLQAGLGNARSCCSEIAGLAKRPFDAAATRAQLARQIIDMEKDGFLRARPSRTGDAEFDRSTAAMVAGRSLDGLLRQHAEFRARRYAQASTARQVCMHGAEMAQMLGLAGTLLTLASLAAAPPGTGSIAGAIGLAVTKTLYGLILANLVFLPLAGMIDRRARAEDEAREELFAWLESHVSKSMPRLHLELAEQRLRGAA